MMWLFIGVILLFSCNAPVQPSPSASASLSPAEARTLFDCTRKRILDESAIQGFVVNGNPEREKHGSSLSLEPIDPADYVNPPPDAGFVARTDADWGIHMLVSRDASQLYLAPTRNFGSHHTVRVGEELPLRSKYFLLELSSRGGYIGYAHFLLQVEMVESLILAHEAWEAPRALDQARQILVHMLARRGDDGRFYRSFADESEPVYRGRIQALLMYELWRYLEHDEDPELRQGLVELSENFVHSTEGTINHRTSSDIGRMIANRVLGSERFSQSDFEANIRDSLQAFEDNGALRYNLPRSGKAIYKERYQGYDLMMLMRLGEFVESDEIYRQIFEGQAFEYSVTTVNERRFLARNLLTLLYAKRQHDHRDPRILDWVTPSIVDCDFPDSWEGVYRLQILAAYLALLEEGAAQPSGANAAPGTLEASAPDLPSHRGPADLAETLE